MTQLTVTNQQELELAINDNVHAEVLLKGDSFTLPKSDKIHAFTFIGVKPQTTVFLSGTMSKSNKYDPKEHRVTDYKPPMVNQFNTVFSAKCENLTVTAQKKIELYFQTEDELAQWKNVRFDKKVIDIVIFEDEINSSEKKERMYEIEQGLNEIGELTIEFIENIQNDFSELIKIFRP